MGLGLELSKLTFKIPHLDSTTARFKFNKIGGNFF